MLAVAMLLLFAALACTSSAQFVPGAHVTPVGTVFATPTFRPVPTRNVQVVTPTAGPTPTLPPISDDELLVYLVQTGDTLAVLADRFEIPTETLIAVNNLNPYEALEVDQVLYIPARLAETGVSFRILPNSELVYSLGVINFDTADFVRQQGGYLAQYREFAGGKMRSGGEIVQLVADRHSVSPRLLVALVEQQSGWVTHPGPPSDLVYPLGYVNSRREGFFQQLNWAADTLNLGYYRWRDGSLQALDFRDAQQVRMAPTLNAGTAAIQYFYSQLYDRATWEAAVGATGLYSTYARLMGDPFAYAIEPLVPPKLQQPPLQLPFLPGRRWLYVAGPHPAWEAGSPWAALDFAPPSLEAGCVQSDEWVAAPAAGLVVRAGDGMLLLDLDGDGHHQSGWVIFFLHMESRDLAPVGRRVEAGDLLGHPSCEGGRALGTHVHVARKFNGEWVPVEGEVPYELSGWTAHYGERVYQGTMTKADQQIRACECSTEVSGIWLGR